MTLLGSKSARPRRMPGRASRGASAITSSVGEVPAGGSSVRRHVDRAVSVLIVAGSVAGLPL